MLPRLLLAVAVLTACGGAPDGGTVDPAPPTATPAGPSLEPPAAEPTPADAPLVVFLGDSLTAGYGLSEEQAFPAVLERRLAAGELAIRVVNAGVSGDTSAGGRRRVDWVLQQQPDVVVVELGANDGLRALPLEMTRQMLDEILLAIEAAGSEALLLGMRVPPNYGPDYSAGFGAIFTGLAELHDVELVPFLLDGVGGRPELNLADGIHPTAEGHEILADNVAPHLLEVLGRLRSGGP